MTMITIELPNERLRRLEEMASKLGVTKEELIRVSVEDMLMQPDDEFQKIAKYVLEKNLELYKRLAA